VIKRYSQFLDLKTRMEKETIRPAAPFPKKGGLVAMSAAAMAKRREGLHDYMEELSGYVTNTPFLDRRVDRPFFSHQLNTFERTSQVATPSCHYFFVHSSFLPEHLHAVLCDFVEMKQRLAKAEKDAAGEAPPLVAGGEAFPNVAPLAAALPPTYPSPASPASGAASGGGAESASSGGGGGSGRKPSWSASFMSEDPLAGLLQPDSPPPPKPEPAPAPAPKPPQEKAPAAAAAPPPAATAPLPPFFSHAAKKYEVSGEGLRDAIKAGDVNGCKQVNDRRSRYSFELFRVDPKLNRIEKVDRI